MGTLAANQLQLPAEILAYRLLPALPEGQAFRRSRQVEYFVGGANATAAPHVAAALQCLITDGLLVQWPPQDPQYTSEGQADMLTLTAWGAKVKMSGDRGRPMVQARRRLGVDLHPALQTKLRDLIAFGAIRNVLAHTDEIEWSDSIEAAEYVLLADLLMRRLDHVEKRVKVQQRREAETKWFMENTELGRGLADGTP